jgi:L-rhamnose mutarotase
METHPVNARWQAEMSPFFEARADGGGESFMLPIEEVFHLD